MKRKHQGLEEGEVKEKPESPASEIVDVVQSSSKLYRKSDFSMTSELDEPKASCSVLVDRKSLLRLGNTHEFFAHLAASTNCQLKCDEKLLESSKKKIRISITGTTKQTIESCKEELLQKISKMKQLPVGNIESYCTIPDNKVGSVIGKKGCNVKKIIEQSGCKVFIPKIPDSNSNPKTRTLRITGPADNIPLCVELISSYVLGKVKEENSKGLQTVKEVPSQTESKQTSNSNYKYTRSQWQEWRAYYQSQGMELQKEAPIGQRSDDYYNS